MLINSVNRLPVVATRLFLHLSAPPAAQQSPCNPTPCLLSARLVLSVCHDECHACRRQSGDARQGERGEDQPGGEIRPPPLFGRPVPERECQLLAFNFHVGLFLSAA